MEKRVPSKVSPARCANMVEFISAWPPLLTTTIAFVPDSRRYTKPKTKVCTQGIQVWS